MSKTHLLSVETLHKFYRGEDGPVNVLRGVSFVLDAGETVALTGESGSGKSTALHLIGGLDVPDRGKVLIDGVDLANLGDSARAALRREHIGVVFQQFNLIPSLSVSDNIAFQSRLAGRYDAAWCSTLADRLGLTTHLRKFPEQLSGGQQQRVAIGRALAHRPALLLADEPTGNLDQTTGDHVLALMLDLVAETGAGLLMVTHSDRLAGQMSRRLHLSAGALT
jgi:putative ABC transport system ATP-binding protein